jgi:hypothetical protein
VAQRRLLTLDKKRRSRTNSESESAALRQNHMSQTVVPLARHGSGPRALVGTKLTFATITNEIREAAPRLRLVSAFPPRKHTTVLGSVLYSRAIGKIICRDFSEPARADAGRNNHWHDAAPGGAQSWSRGNSPGVLLAFGSATRKLRLQRSKMLRYEKRRNVEVSYLPRVLVQRNAKNVEILSVPFSTVVVTDSERLPKV